MKVITAFLKYDYGIKERGDSLEKNYFLPALKKTGADIYTFWLEENGFPEDISLLQNKLIEFSDSINPDLLFFILMNNEITVDTIKNLSAKYKTINWFCDDQWRFESFTKNIAPYLSYCITVDKYSLPKYQKLGCKNIILSQWATNSITKKKSLQVNEYKYNISFVGGKNLTRQWIISELKTAGYHIDCFGSGWSNGRISFDEMKRIFLTSKINLNLSNSIPTDFRYRRFLFYFFFRIFFKFSSDISFKESIFNKLRILRDLLFPFHGEKKVEQMKARNFEIPGNGGFQLSVYAPGIEDYYIIGKEIAIFSSIDDLKSKIEYYLINDAEREEIKISGYQRTMTYSYENKMNEIMRLL